MLAELKLRWHAMVARDLHRYQAYVLGKAALVAVMLLLLWALKDKDVVVVYMKF